MKKLLLLFVVFIFNCTQILPQIENVYKDKLDYQNFVIPKSHDPNFLKLNKQPAKSFYQSISDWQRIIDSTWGPGYPLTQKLQIYNTFAQKIRNEFDGFISLNLNWDSLYNHYLSKINDSTSKGAFSSIISHFAYDLKDMHTRAFDSSVVFTTLNPGVPVLLIGSYISIEHFGAVTTVLPDSTTLVLRVVPNHPLDLEPGDIILGYEGIPWKVLVKELLDAGLPMIATTGGCKTADTYLNFSGVGLNWHLFSTIDILKHSTGNIQHLSVLPLLTLNLPPTANNEQLPISNIPFPNILPYPVINDTVVTYGVLNNTNIGYIYLAKENPQITADDQFFNAVNALKNTDALVIDMRLNFGGWAFFDKAFEILFNEDTLTIEDSYRCNTTTFNLCPLGNANVFQINAKLADVFDRPIAVLLGPTCVSMGDVTAHRLRYHPMVKFFGASSNSSMGDNKFYTLPGWFILYSVGDMFHSSQPGVYLNRREFPIDFPVWHNRDDVAIGKDAVVEKALWWINNLVYHHNTIVDKSYYSPENDTVHLSTIIQNPNSHQLSATAYIKSINSVVIDSVNFEKQTSSSTSELWTANFNLPSGEEFYKISATVFDETESASFSGPNAARFTTAGPVVLDSISYRKGVLNHHYVRPFVHNSGTVKTVTNAKLRISSDDPWIEAIGNSSSGVSMPDIAPDSTVGISTWIAINVIDSLFPGYFNLRAEIMSDGWAYWTDSMKVNVITEVEEEFSVPIAYKLEQNYPNPFNPITKIKYSVPSVTLRQAQSDMLVTLKVYDVLGNEIAILVNEEKEAGSYEVEFNADNRSSGVYFYQLKAGEFVSTKKMILLR
jgi:hypothetical protein